MIKLPEPRRKIPDLRKLALKKRQEWPHGRKAFGAVYNKATRQGVVIRAMQDPAKKNLVHYWRVA